MRIKALCLLTIILMVISIPATFAYTDPVSITIIWQFLASILVGALFFFKQIRVWVMKIFKNKHDK